MKKDILKSVVVSLIVSASIGAFTAYVATQQNTKDIQRNTKNIEEVKRDYVTRRELDLKIASLERTVNRIDRNTEKVINFMINLKK